MRNMKTTTSRWFALLLVLVYLVSLTACNNQQPVATEPSESVPPVETEPHSHEFTDGLCQCGESNGFDAFTVFTADGLTAVERQDEEAQFSLTSSNAAGETGAIRLDTQFDAVYGHYYEAVYKFTSNVAGSVRFASPDAVFYDTDTYEVENGENEIVVRFAAGQAGKIAASLELGSLEPFELTFTEASVTELKADFSKYFLDVAPENASGNMNLTADGALAATFKTNEGWRIKLAVDRSLVKGKTYETTFVFTKENGKSQNVTYTVYDNAATIIGSRTKWVDSDLCVATFYLTANETITKGTCLELGMISGGEEASMTFTYIDFEEVDAAKLEKLLAENPFPGVNVWTEGALTPAVGTQSAEGLRLTNTNPATDWWKVKLEQELQCQKGKYYRVTFGFTSNAAGRIKFVNDDATYYGSNEFDVKQGENTFTVELKSGGNSYSCLELGGLGPCELLFTEIKVESIDEPSKAPTNPGTSATRFSSFKVWKDASVQSVVRKDTATTMTLTSQNDPTDWWKIKVEKDLSGTAGKCYELTYTFTSNAAGRIKFVNDDAFYYGGNEYDVVAGENTFTVQFKYGGKPYSCLELGGLSPFQLVFTNYSIKEIEEPVYESNGFERYQAWTEASMKLLTREDTATSMILISENEPGDWWKVKVENNFPTEAGKTYEAVYTFTSDAEGDIKFGGDNMTCHTPDIYHVVAGENTFSVTFTVSASNAYNCLELGGLGNFRLEFTAITLTETAAPEVPEDHTHSFVNGICTCGETNGFAGFGIWNEGSLTPVVREDTENSMIITSENASGDWWKVKVENNFPTEAGKTYEAVYTFTSNAEGDIKFGGDNMTCHTPDVYHVAAGENTFSVTFTVSASNAYNCLELGGLGNFRLEFTSITLTETAAPEVPEDHTHSFVNGICTCGETNGFAGFGIWNEGSLTPVVREDTENSMIITSENAAGDWWKVKVENNFATEADKTYEAVYTFSSNAEGDIKFGGDNMTCHTPDVYHVAAGENTFSVTFTVSASNAYNCLELGGLGNFRLEFTSITLKEVSSEPEHTHSFVNGKCECGESNGFAGFGIWNEGSLTPVVREDAENSMIITSENASGDWWKVKVENNFPTEAGKTYEAVYTFTSDAEGDIKFGGDNMTCQTPDVYHVVAGENTFSVTFTVSASNAYNCLELGGLGNFRLEFTSITLKEVSNEPEHTHSFVNGKCECGETNGFAGFGIWNEGSLTPVVREDTENSMIITSENASGDWWKVKVENNSPTEAGKTYEAVYTFTSDAEGDIKFGGDNMTCHTPDIYHVVAGENTFSVTFTVSASNAYNCLELGGLGNFRLEFTAITLTETTAPEVPEDHTHSFVNGICTCGETNGFAGFGIWNESSLTPVVREDTENSMIITSSNAPGDWWKVKVELPLSVEEGKTYEVTFVFNSTAAGRIKYHVGGANFLTGQEYDVVVGENTFTVRFTAGSDNYSCLELGGLGNFTLTFTGVSFKEV